MKHLKARKVVCFALIVAVMTMALPVVASAAKSKNPYKDVTRKTVDKDSYNAIKFVKKYKGWQGLVKKGKLYPNRYMTKHELYIVLHNLYGTRVPASVVTACKGKKTTLNSQFVCNQLVALGNSLGHGIRWSGSRDKMKRKDVARYIRIFAKFNPAFMPKPASSGSTKADLLAMLKKLLGL